jgi:hypothetical protein
MKKVIYTFSKFNRDYFMYIDYKGYLYLEETELKNFTSCIKDDRFFVNISIMQSFFFKNLVKNQTGRH